MRTVWYAYHKMATTSAGSNGLQWYGWDVFLNIHFKTLKGIEKFQHFRFTAEEPGVVFAEHSLDSPEVWINLFKERVTWMQFSMDFQRLSLQLDFQQTENAISSMRLDIT
uniref:Uncharacterized protein n=1 Tax=Magallana gigas TaxID=29159 RepID=A0A8W8JI63_MAGGI